MPEAKFETVVAKPSEIQKEMVQELSKRAAEIHSGAVDASVDNMLCVTNDGRKIGLDVRLMNPMLPDDPKSARLAELNAQLDVDEKSHEPEQEEEPDEDAPRRPSVLAALEEKSDKPEPVKPFRSYYDKDGDAR